MQVSSIVSNALYFIVLSTCGKSCLQLPHPFHRKENLYRLWGTPNKSQSDISLYRHLGLQLEFEMTGDNLLEIEQWLDFVLQEMS